jgi:hypothetical protein
VSLLALLDLQRSSLFLVLIILLVDAMDEKSHWPFSVKKFPPTFEMPKLFGIDPAIVKTIYEDRYKGNPCDDPIAYLEKFEKRCESIKIDNVSNERIKVKMFPYSLCARSQDWFLNWPLGTFHSWYNIKAALKERFCLPPTISFNRELIFSFKQRYDEKFIHTWERFRGVTYKLNRGLRDWMIIHAF